jgi:hypothetical protein
MSKQEEKQWMRWLKSWPQEMRAFGASIIFLLIGLLALLMAKFALKIDQDAVLVTILLVPVLIYLILSGQLKEIRGPGGLGAIFNDAAHRPSLEIRQQDSEWMDVADMVALARGDPDSLALNKKLYELSRARRHIVLTVTLGNKQEYYDPDSMANYLKMLLEYRSFRFLVILDESKEVFAYISGWRAIKFINFEKKISGQDSPFVTAINRRDKDGLRRYELIEETVKITDSNENILEKMMKSRLDALIVTYPDGRLKGVVRREQVLSELMLALIESHSQSK